MKHFFFSGSLLVAAYLAAPQASHAQQAVPNGALDTWTTRNGGEAPAQWQTTDDVLNTVLPGYPATAAVQKSTSAHAGSFAAQLTNRNGLQGSVPGFLFLGNATGSIFRVDSLDELGGLPYTSRAARLQFYYKFTGTVNQPSDRPTAAIMLTRTVAGVRTVVASGKRYLASSAAGYTLADIPLTYRQGYAPDSVHIAFGAGDYNENSFTAGNSLSVDDVTLTGTVTATRDAQLQAAVSVYPNPSATGLFTLAASAEAALLAAPLTVHDALGRVVLQQAAAPANASTRTIDLRPQAPGLYSLRLDTSRGPLVYQLEVR